MLRLDFGMKVARATCEATSERCASAISASCVPAVFGPPAFALFSVNLGYSAKDFEKMGGPDQEGGGAEGARR